MIQLLFVLLVQVLIRYLTHDAQVRDFVEISQRKAKGPMLHRRYLNIQGCLKTELRTIRHKPKKTARIVHQLMFLFFLTSARSNVIRSDVGEASAASLSARFG